MTSWTHVLAIVVGAARPDGDVYAHFGSLLGFEAHLDTALRLGLVERAPEPIADDTRDIVLTDTGRAFIETYHLADLPAGRANYWHGPRADPLIEPASAELTRRWNAMISHQAPSSPNGAA